MLPRIHTCRGSARHLAEKTYTRPPKQRRLEVCFSKLCCKPIEALNDRADGCWHLLKSKFMTRRKTSHPDKLNQEGLPRFAQQATLALRSGLG